MSDAQEQQGSEVARLLAQIRLEYESAQRGISGVAYGNTKHAFITQRLENMGKLQEELQTLIGEDASIALIAEQLSAVPETKSSPV